jgi:hypothetical protein
MPLYRSLTVEFNIINFAFQIFPFLVSETSASIPPYITQIIFIHYTWDEFILLDEFSI